MALFPDLLEAPIRRLPPELADQIAAGEVVERPASVVKELVDNAVDAGATRVDVDLLAAGTQKIVVVDDGHGIPAAQLPLALVRHATSKVLTQEDLLEPRCLGFRGEALASIAAVAHVTVETRVRDGDVGTRLRAHPGLSPATEPCGGASGTRVEVERLFANIPARRKFLRSHATELNHCVDAVVRIAAVHPDVTFHVVHEGRVLLDLARDTIDGRIARLCERRGAKVVHTIRGDWDGVGVTAWIATMANPRERADVSVIVRRRVVRERAMAQICREAWEPVLGREPMAWIAIDPPRGTVDVNVHPQKAEVRFADPQTIYAAIRRCFSQRRGACEHDETGPVSSSAVAATPLIGYESRDSWPPQRDSVGVSEDRGKAQTALGWERHGEEDGGSTHHVTAPATGVAYSLRTRALAPEYAQIQAAWRGRAQALGTSSMHETVGASGYRVEPESQSDAGSAGPELLDCLPGAVGVFRHGDGLLVVDLPRIRTYLLYRRLASELGAGALRCQALLQPVVIGLPPVDVAVCAEAKQQLQELGIVVEPFGDDAVVVRAVPAQLQGGTDELNVAQMLTKVLPYARQGLQGNAVQALAGAIDGAIVPRFARAFMRELVQTGVELDQVEGIRRWSAEALLRRA